MIPRYQKLLLWLLLVSSVLMAAYLIRLRARAQDQLAAIPDAAHMPVPVETAPAPVTLLIANDTDGSLSPIERQLALPVEPTTRARTLLNDLFAAYAEPASPHPLAAVSAVNDVFLLPLPAAPASSAARLAVINLNGEFVDHHPSGILVETLTLLSILGTLHANLPQIAQVQFLVDGRPRETLAGHADLTRAYLTAGDVPQAAGDVQPAPGPPAATETSPPQKSPEAAP